MKSASRIIVWASLVAIALLSLSCGTAREGHQTSASKIPDELPVGIKGYREVFYSTDRSPGESGTFGTEASDDAKLRFGRVIVSIPAVHTRGELERPWRVFSVSLPEDSRKQIVIAARRSLAEDSFFGQVSYAIDTAPEKEAFVFVHGFNVPFDDAVLRTGQLAWDMKFRGPAITYSWPSAGKTSRYVADLDMADWTAPHLATFLQNLRRLTGKRVIHLVAHSMGSRVLSMALDRLATANPTSIDRFQEVVLAAPDMNNRVLLQLASVFKAEADRVTLYASNRDGALRASAFIRRSHSRAGSDAGSIAASSGWDVIDATQAKASLLGHSYFAENTTLLNDLSLLLRQRLSPDQRSITLDRSGAVWIFRP